MAQQQPAQSKIAWSIFCLIGIMIAAEAMKSKRDPEEQAIYDVIDELYSDKPGTTRKPLLIPPPTLRLPATLPSVSTPVIQPEVRSWTDRNRKTLGRSVSFTDALDAVDEGRMAAGADASRLGLGLRTTARERVETSGRNWQQYLPTLTPQQQAVLAHVTMTNRDLVFTKAGDFSDAMQARPALIKSVLRAAGSYVQNPQVYTSDWLREQVAVVARSL